MPPTLDYPDTLDTPDTELYQGFHSRDGRLMRDTGFYTDLPFDIVDGKKIYKRFAGVNQPVEEI